MSKTRSVEKRIEIAAPPETVWKALTDAKELTRWFPLHAKVEPGVGGSVWLSWGPAWEGASRIDIWEPGRRLRTVAAPPPGETTTATGQTPEPWLSGAAPIVLEFQLEARGGSTVLRLVHSGFGTDAAWDDEYDSVNRGWDFELRSLRHYLATHFGKDRHVAWVRRPVGVSKQEAWSRLMGSEGLAAQTPPAGLKEGDRYAFETSTGESFDGEVLIWDPPHQFSGTAANMGQALWRLELYKSPRALEVSLWLGSYSTPVNELSGIQHRWEAMVERLLPETAA